MLWLARCNDLLDLREKALQLYHQALDQKDMEISCSAGLDAAYANHTGKLSF
jgi:hypothetical protein